MSPAFTTSRTGSAAVLLGVALAACQAARAPGSSEDDAPATAAYLGSVFDPGPRGGDPGAGAPLAGLGASDLAAFQAGLDEFNEVASVGGDSTLFPDTDRGLGPRYNAESCAVCHAQPAIGGTSPALNPQVASATLGGATNRVPWFVTETGPVREARFVLKPDGSRDGGVAALFVISGRADAVGCTLAQPNFGAPGNPLTGRGGSGNLIFRIPTPVFGGGLIEAIPDAVLIANRDASRDAKHTLGINGRPNRSGNDGTITRFGWKAQNKSLMLFAAEAYNVEQGVTNEIFGDERDQATGCELNPTPEDSTAFDDPAAPHSALVRFAAFMRFLAPPVPGPDNGSIVNGRKVFETTGCALCHTPTLQTGKGVHPALADQPVNLYSDLLLHDMGEGLADGIVQGVANRREFRTAPLWGLGQRLFFLHDGRTGDLVEAIAAHRSRGSEASNVIYRFRQLTDQDRQDVLNFLRSL